jgi:hypothetical protein
MTRLTGDRPSGCSRARGIWHCRGTTRRLPHACLILDRAVHLFLSLRLISPDRLAITREIARIGR